VEPVVEALVLDSLVPETFAVRGPCLYLALFLFLLLLLLLPCMIILVSKIAEFEKLSL
jgi:hypothetical protein